MIRRSALSLLVLATVASCSDDEEITLTPDTTPPLEVTDLQADPADAASIRIGWTASGDDGAEGTAASYDIRWSPSSISESDWQLAAAVPSAPTPGPAGSAESLLVTGLDPGTTYFYALKVSDDAGNLSGLSNVASASTPNPPPPSPGFLPQTSPENVVNNLQVAYRTRNSEEYSRLLAPEFIFVFQPIDVPEVGEDFWNRDQDSTGTGNLFSAALVSNISIELFHGSAGPVNEPGFPPEAMKIRITQTLLEVDQTDGTSLLAEDLQDMFFRPGDTQLGEDPTEWFMIEWRDIPSPVAQLAGPLPGNLSTWGKIKTRY